ncbi:hypothetical protein [Methylobacterium cerastii]|uniref:hypothetical protein n=1 Tax=Methylobacterium cerastii TaxID=932741 RepID=UPI001EE1F32D|nr:hypothetical protein [Methylobacterium cerastii]
MSVYNIYLVDIEDAIGSDNKRAEVKHFIKDYFDKVCKKAGIKEGCSVQFVTTNPQAKKHELIMYYMKRTPHIVENIKHDNLPPTHETSTGFTKWNSKEHGSDMEASSAMDSRDIANITFHEFMHQKLHLSDKLHTKDGLAGDVNSSLSEDNIKLMAAKLMANHPQWTGGFAILEARKNGDVLAY